MRSPKSTDTMDGVTITLIVGIIGCVIGVSTFVSALLSKAQNNGVLAQKIEQALQGIEEIKTRVNDSAANQTNTSLIVQKHEEQIKTLYNITDDLKGRLNTAENINGTLNKILDAIKSLKEDQE